MATADYSQIQTGIWGYGERNTKQSGRPRWWPSEVMKCNEDPLTLQQLIEAYHFRHWNKLVRTIIRVLRFINESQKKNGLGFKTSHGPSTSADYEIAEMLLIRQVQKRISGEYEISKWRLYKADGGICRAAERIDDADVGKSANQPVYLPLSDVVTELRMRNSLSFKNMKNHIMRGSSYTSRTSLKVPDTKRTKESKKRGRHVLELLPLEGLPAVANAKSTKRKFNKVVCLKQ